MFPVSLFLLLLGIFLYMDRFLFKGALARLFIEGWGQILHRKKKCGPPAASASAAPASGEKLILCKEYIEGTERQQGEQTPENESTNEGNTTFTSATGASVQPEILEWCDPAYFSDIPSKKSSVPYMDVDSKSLRWEDDDFAGRISAADPPQPELSFETERIRREVAASLEDWRIDEARIEAEMSAEEAFDVEAFDVDAYR